MPEALHRIAFSCLTLVIVAGIILGLLLVVGIGLLITSPISGSL